MLLPFCLLNQIILTFLLFNIEIVKSETNIIECYECETQSTDNIDEMKRDSCYTLAGNGLEFKKCLTSQQCSVRESKVNSENFACSWACWWQMSHWFAPGKSRYHRWNCFYHICYFQLLFTFFYKDNNGNRQCMKLWL